MGQAPILVSQQGVYHRGSDIAVTELLLYVFDVDATSQGVGGVALHTGGVA